MNSPGDTRGLEVNGPGVNGLEVNGPGANCPEVNGSGENGPKANGPVVKDFGGERSRRRSVQEATVLGAKDLYSNRSQGVDAWSVNRLPCLSVFCCTCFWTLLVFDPHYQFHLP